MATLDIAREIAALDIEQAVLALNPSEETCDIGRRATEALDQKAISVHVVDYGETVLLRVADVVTKMPIGLARELLQELARVFKV